MKSKKVTLSMESKLQRSFILCNWTKFLAQFDGNRVKLNAFNAGFNKFNSITNKSK